MILWLILAVAFIFVAIGYRADKRAVAITAWLTSAAAVVAAAAFVATFLPHVWTFVGMLPELTFLALIAFGVTVHRPFGWWWSIPAAAAGLFGVLGYTFSPPYSIFSHFVLEYSSLAIFAIMLVPLFVLGIAMCWTRVGGQPRLS
jgi:hypothetical protein